MEQEGLIEKESTERQKQDMKIGKKKAWTA